MATYVIKFTCNFLGDYGYTEIEAMEPPDDWELEEMAMDHFMPGAEIIEVIDDEEE